MADHEVNFVSAARAPELRGTVAPAGEGGGDAAPAADDVGRPRVLGFESLAQQPLGDPSRGHLVLAAELLPAARSEQRHAVVAGERTGSRGQVPEAGHEDGGGAGGILDQLRARWGGEHQRSAGLPPAGERARPVGDLERARGAAIEAAGHEGIAEPPGERPRFIEARGHEGPPALGRRRDQGGGREHHVDAGHRVAFAVAERAVGEGVDDDRPAVLALHGTMIVSPDSRTMFWSRLVPSSRSRKLKGIALRSPRFSRRSMTRSRLANSRKPPARASACAIVTRLFKGKAPEVVTWPIT